MRVESTLWLFPALVTLHNMEESIWLPSWMQRTRSWRTPIAAPAFRFGAIVLTAAAFFLAWMSIRSGRQSFWIYLLFGSMIAMLGNALVPHLALSLARRESMPGLATGLFNLLVLPVLAGELLRAHWVSGTKAILAGICVPILLLVTMATIFRLGKAVRTR